MTAAELLNEALVDQAHPHSKEDVADGLPRPVEKLAERALAVELPALVALELSPDLCIGHDDVAERGLRLIPV